MPQHSQCSRSLALGFGLRACSFDTRSLFPNSSMVLTELHIQLTSTPPLTWGHFGICWDLKNCMLLHFPATLWKESPGDNLISWRNNPLLLSVFFLGLHLTDWSFYIRLLCHSSGICQNRFFPALHITFKLCCLEVQTKPNSTDEKSCWKEERSPGEKCRTQGLQKNSLDCQYHHVCMWNKSIHTLIHGYVGAHPTLKKEAKMGIH